MTRTYEMLWDCEFCGQKKLLGKTHKHCPHCGGAQDPRWRYFPSDAEKVPVEGHVFVGADWLCPACTSPNAAEASHCGQCGSDKTGAREAPRRAPQTSSSGFAGETVADAKREHAEAQTKVAAGAAGVAGALATLGAVGLWMRHRKKVVALALGGPLLAFTVVALVWKRDVDVTVRGHTWERAIDIERFGPVSESAWCDAMPSDAYSVSRSREVRSYNEIPDGETCSTVRTDNGNGTFSESQQCTTKYRREPVYDDKCSYTVDRWRYSHTVRNNGASVHDSPTWPASGVSGGTCHGCEREGARHATYTVHFVVNGEGDDKSCHYAQNRWATYPVEGIYHGRMGVLTGWLDCDELKIASGGPGS